VTSTLRCCKTRPEFRTRRLSNSTATERSLPWTDARRGAICQRQFPRPILFKHRSAGTRHGRARSRRPSRPHPVERGWDSGGRIDRNAKRRGRCAGFLADPKLAASLRRNLIVEKQIGDEEPVRRPERQCAVSSCRTPARTTPRSPSC
jgi:hypothetical protein